MLFNMKTTFKSKVVIESDKFRNFDETNELPEFSFKRAKDEIEKGHYLLEFIGSGLTSDCEPTIIIKI